jgi:hypothetical protein
MATNTNIVGIFADSPMKIEIERLAADIEGKRREPCRRNRA